MVEESVEAFEYDVDAPPPHYEEEEIVIQAFEFWHDGSCPEPPPAETRIEEEEPVLAMAAG